MVTQDLVVHLNLYPSKGLKKQQHIFFPSGDMTSLDHDLGWMLFADAALDIFY